MKTLKHVYGGKRTYQGIGGDNIIQTIDEMTRADLGTTNTRYRVTENASEHEITMMVNAFDCSFGRLELMASDFIKVDTNGDPDPEAMAILNMELWHMDQLIPLYAEDLPDLGGGPNGYVKESHALLCDSPKGNGKIYNT
jgi:hypothetical protein